jgi:saccharopine dehydrogenase (NAD+, L-lysine-forming)
MIKLSLIREGKLPHDNRVVFTPFQCKWIGSHYPEFQISVQPSTFRCFSDQEYLNAGIHVMEDLRDMDILFGIKEVPPSDLFVGKTYFIFSHTKKRQAYNQKMMQAFIAKKITLIDYECLVHEDGQRILGFGFFAGVVGAHNGLKAYGIKTKTFKLPPVHGFRDFRDLIHVYFGLKLPPIKIAVTGSGRVSSGCIEVMNLLGIKNIDPEEFMAKNFAYPVFTQLKGMDLYERIEDGGYHRDHFHLHPDQYRSKFSQYLGETDILMNGIYWEHGMPQLFTRKEMEEPRFRIQVIADITCDANGSVLCNLGSSTIEDPVYGVDRFSLARTLPYQNGTVDIMTVDNLPNELPRDASQYFGEQLIKEVLPRIQDPESRVMKEATILQNGILTPHFQYLKEYAYPTG